MSGDAQRLERAAHLRKDIHFLQAELRSDQTLIVPLVEEQVFVSEGRLVLVPLARGKDLLDGDGELVWLGRLGERSVFALDVSALSGVEQHPELAQGKLEEPRMALGLLPTAEAMIAAFARGILYWHGRQRHCGACGSPTAPREGGHLRVCRDETCAAQHFPRTDPAVIVLVHDGDRCLLGRQARWPKGMYSTLAGFVEPGETIEEAVAREVQEEAGVVVHDVRYFRSQPWPFPASLMLGFFAGADASAELRIGDDELEDARWVPREHLRAPREHGFFVPGGFSLAGQLIDAFVREAMP